MDAAIFSGLICLVMIVLVVLISGPEYQVGDIIRQLKVEGYPEFGCTGSSYKIIKVEYGSYILENIHNSDSVCKYSYGFIHRHYCKVKKAGF